MYKLYYRRSLMDAVELSAASKYFSCTPLLSNIKTGDQVIYRYSLYPFALDQEREVLNIGAKPINSYSQHQYVADLQNYYYDFQDLTPKTWFSLTELPEEGPFILKGETNSKKSEWNTSMFAKTKQDAITVHSRLCSDSLISQQKICIRQYIPLVSYLTGIGGIPITNEHRFVFAFGKVIAGDFYWQNYVDDLEFKPDTNQVPQQLLTEIGNRLKNKINLAVVDIAQKQDGNWIIIELNDFSQSGLSCIDPEILYKNLHQSLIQHAV